MFQNSGRPLFTALTQDVPKTPLETSRHSCSSEVLKIGPSLLIISSELGKKNISRSSCKSKSSMKLRDLT